MLYRFSGCDSQATEKLISDPERIHHFPPFCALAREIKKQIMIRVKQAQAMRALERLRLLHLCNTMLSQTISQKNLTSSEAGSVIVILELVCHRWSSDLND